MTDIIDVMNNLIRRVKGRQSLKDIRFIKEYSNRTAEKPAKGMSAVVQLISVEKCRGFIGDLYSGKGESYTGKAKFRLRLSCGASGSGEQLSLCALSLAQSMVDEDLEGYIEDYSVGSIAYDADTGAIFRDINMVIGYVRYAG